MKEFQEGTKQLLSKGDIFFLFMEGEEGKRHIPLPHFKLHICHFCENQSQICVPTPPPP